LTKTIALSSNQATRQNRTEEERQSSRWGDEKRGGKRKQSQKLTQEKSGTTQKKRKINRGNIPQPENRTDGRVSREGGRVRSGKKGEGNRWRGSSKSGAPKKRKQPTASNLAYEAMPQLEVGG